jgi:hypothetical protein
MYEADGGDRVQKDGTQQRGETIILHVSDLHVGIRFDQHKWQDLLELAARIKPDLITVTGDVVNSPWRWTVRRARGKLPELERCARQPTRDVGAQLAPDTGTSVQPAEAIKPRSTCAGDDPRSTPPRLICVPGNHDIRWQGILPLGAIGIGLFVAAVVGTPPRRRHLQEGDRVLRQLHRHARGLQLLNEKPAARRSRRCKTASAANWPCGMSGSPGGP